MQNDQLFTNSIPNYSIEYLASALDRKDEIESFVSDWLSDTPVIQIKTSGSTGTPKTIEVEKKYLAASAKMTIDYFGLSKDQNALLVLNTTSIAGKMMIIRAIIAEMKLIIGPVSSNPLKDLEQSIDFAAMVPLQIQEVIDSRSDQIKRIEKILIGGAAINDYLWERIASLPVSCYQSFGMTETYSHFALRRIDLTKAPFEILNGVSISCNPTLEISIPALGISNLKTTDEIELVDEAHFYWKGRTDFVINSGGIKIHPEEIEQKIDHLIPHPFFSTKVPDDKYGEIHVLCIEGIFTVDTDSIEANLSKYEQPKEIYFFENFHYTHTGKIDRKNTLLSINNALRQIL